MKKLLGLFSSLFNKTKQENSGGNECVLPPQHFKHYTRDELLGLLDLNTISNVELITTDKPNLLIVDDIPDTAFILKATCNEINRRYAVDFMKDFKMTFITSESCGLTAYKFILRKDIKIDYAVIDISIGTRVNVPNADILEIDGIDLAEIILREHPDAKITFFTAHTLSRDDKRMKKYYKKCAEAFRRDLEDMSILKNDERTDGLYKFLYNR